MPTSKIKIAASCLKLDTDTVMVDIETYIKSAQQHGEDSEPDHEIGDLQVFLRAAFRHMSTGERHAFAADPEVAETLSTATA